MTRRMTIVFDDEELYTHLKVEAARAHRPAKDLVAEALHLFFESTAGGQDATQAPARIQRSARRASPVEDILQQLGMGKEPLDSPSRERATSPP